MTARLPWTVRWRLSILWALQWGITGTILTYLPLYLTQSGLNAEQQGQLMAVTAVGLWFAPLLVGQVADRWLATERYLALSHFVGGVTLSCIPHATLGFQETNDNFLILLFLVGLYSVAYFPTVALASSLSFRHLSDPQSQFGYVRVWGTVGWMLAGLALSVWLGQADALLWLRENIPAAAGLWFNLGLFLEWLPSPSSSDCFRMAAVLSFALSSFCVFLPHTPPVPQSRRRFAPLEVLKMFQDRTFTLLILISFLLSLVVPLYTLQVPKLLEQLGFENEWIPAVMLIGQISEFPALFLLPFFLKRFGLKATFALGMMAWLVRYVFFAFEHPWTLILLGLALHGVCHVFLIIVIQLFVDSRCKPDVRASAQNLFTFVTMGVGMPLGSIIGGKLGQWWFDIDSGRTNYLGLFSLPAVFIFTLLLIYWKWFHFQSAVAVGPPPAQRDVGDET